MLCLSNIVDSYKTVRDVLFEKHPTGQPAHPDSIIEDDQPEVHPILCDRIWENPLYGIFF